MKLEDQVISLDLAKKMKELGFEQESLFKWALKSIYLESGTPKSYVTEKHYDIILDDENSFDGEYFFNAYTVAELGKMLPENVMSFKSPDKKTWICRYYDYHGTFEFDTYQEIHKTEANARAKMFIYLKENNLLEDNTL